MEKSFKTSGPEVDRVSKGHDRVLSAFDQSNEIRF